MQLPDLDVISKVKSAMLCIQRFHWEQGCVAQAILEYDGPSDEVLRLCEAAVFRSVADGRIGVMDKNEAVNDPAAIGEALIIVGRHYNRSSFITAADKLYQYLKFKAPRTEDGILYHFDSDWSRMQVWVDAFYMTPPFLCAYGDVDEAIKQIKGFRKYLYQKDKKLNSHIWDHLKKEYGRKDCWGVGNGWTIAGLVRVISMLGEDYTDTKEELIDYLKELIDGFIAYQREDGLFHDVLDDPNSFVETNAGQMLAYGIYRGVKAGYLGQEYLVYADKARAAAYSMVDNYGFVRGVCGMPQFNSPGIATEGQAFFLLMEAAARDLYQ